MEPAATPFDLRWRLFGIHFRVHPAFWGVNLLFGYLYIMHATNNGRQLFIMLAVWVACAFVSILVHELGHVLTGRAFGESGNIVLGSTGGLALGRYDLLSRWQRILMTMAGPGAGLLLFAFVYFALPDLGERSGLRALNPWYFDVAVHFLVIQNLFWSLFNLLPIVPLDGGLIMKDLVTGVVPNGGLRLAYGFSFLFAASVAVYSVMKIYNRDLPYPPLDPMFNLFIFGMFAFSSFTGLQAAAVHEKRSRYEEKDW